MNTPNPRPCTLCHAPLVFAGIREFRTGGSSGTATFFFGQLAESTEQLFPLAVWGCRNCGKVELFLPTVTS